MTLREAIEIVTGHIRKRPLPVGDDPQVNERLVEACEKLETVYKLLGLLELSCREKDEL